MVVDAVTGKNFLEGTTVFILLLTDGLFLFLFAHRCAEGLTVQ